MTANSATPLAPRLFSGLATSPGIAVGHVHIVDRRRVTTPKRHISQDEVPVELQRFDRALQVSLEQLERIKKKLVLREGEEHSLILEAHQLILQDEHLVEPTRRRIREERMNAEWALRRTVKEIKAIFEAIEEDYFRERRSDVDFVGERILRNLLGVEVSTALPPTGAIVVAHDLSPADTAQLHRSACEGFITNVGGKTSHSAILARAFQIPSVVIDQFSELVGHGDELIIDGLNGLVILHPTTEQVHTYREKAARYKKYTETVRRNREQPAQTTDGARIRLYANIEIADELPATLEHGAEGIGLYRTEFLFMDRADLPSEDEHFVNARGVLRRLYPYPVTFRTFDLGGDKVSPLTPQRRERNPSLGLRSIRLCLKEIGLFKAQLRGLLRASVHGRLRLLFPMISGVTELREARAVLDEVKADLDREGIPYDKEVPLGVMIEMPSAVMVADKLAQECDFFSIGTNDLIQYSLAIDRGNEHVSYLYHPLHLGILRMIHSVTEIAHTAGIRTGVCGEMAGEPFYSAVLIGLGIDELSMNSISIPIVKEVIRKSSLFEARKLVEQIKLLNTEQEIEDVVHQHVTSRYPADLLEVAGAPQQERSKAKS